MSTKYCAALLLLLLLVASRSAPATAAASRRASTTTADESRRDSITADESRRDSTAAAESRSASTTAGTSFGRSSWKSNLTLLGAASFVKGQTAVALTTNSTGAGRALFTEPVRLLLPRADPRAAPAPASFYTRFQFRIVPSPSYGDGLAFILTSSRTYLGASNGFLGIYASDGKAGELSDVYTVAVELDTHLDAALGDPDDNHVALDEGSIFSAASANPGVDLKSGKRITAWLDYRASRRRMRAWFSYSSRRPRNPVLTVVIDLSRLLHDDIYVGFSASNGAGTAIHIIDSWTFQTQSRSQRSSSRAPPPVPVPSAAAPPKNSSPAPVPTDGQHGHLKFVVAFVSTVVTVVILVVYCIRCLGRRAKSKKCVEMCNILPKSAPRSS